MDNWQRINKTVVANASGAEEITDEQRDSLAQAAEQEELLKQTSDSAVNDPHRREYYLAQIPFTPEQLAESNKLLEDGLYHAGVIFKDKLNNLPLSRKSLLRLVNNHPDYAHLDDAYYHLYLLYSRERKPEMAQTYLQKLKAEYPESQWTTLLSDPYYAENAKRGVQIEDSLYTLTYQAFRDGEYDKVERNAQISRNRFPDGANRDKFLFIGGLSKLNDGDIKSCLADLKEVVSKYPDSRLSEMAGMIINGVDAGRRLYGGKFDLNDVWTRRSIELNDRDSTRQKGYSPERNASFVFLLAYDPNKTNENQLLFEMAKYNFTSYMARSFDINIEDLEGLHRMQISGFNSYDEARQYANAVYQQPAIKRLLGNVRAYVISEPNLKLLGTSHTYEEYEKFYSKHFAPLPVSKLPLLLEPAETAPAAEEEPSSEEATSEESPKAEQSQEDNTLTVPITPQDEPLNSGELEVEGKKEEIPEKKDDGVLVIPNQKEKKDDGTLVIPNQKKEKKEEDTGIYFDDSNSSESIELEDEYFELEGF